MAWAYTGVVTITGNSSLLPATQTNFPVCLLLNSANCTVGGINRIKTAANGGAIQNTGSQASGPAVTMPFDLVFYSDSGLTTKIPWEVENYNGTTGVLWVWVLQASCSLSSNLYFGFGDVAVNSAQNTGSFVPANVWDSNFKCVYHLQDATRLINDSTSNALTLTNTGAVSTGVGEVGLGGAFNGFSTEYLSASAASLPSGTAVRTLSAWIKNGANQLMKPVGWGSNSGNGCRWVITYTGTNLYQIECLSMGSVFSWTYDTNWHHIAFSLPSGTTTASILGYLDGVSQSMTPGAGTLNTTTTELKMSGIPTFTGAGNSFTGTLDEVRISDIARSANWITAEYASTNAPQTFAVAVVTGTSSTSVANPFLGAAIGIQGFLS